MSPKRAGILFWKDLSHCSKSFIFIIAIVTPILTSIAVSLLFGNLFSQKPKIGIVDRGTSRILTLIAESQAITCKEYELPSMLKKAVSAGAVDIGVVLPKGFDQRVISGLKTKVTAYIWGESLIKNRALAGAIVAQKIRELTGQKPPIEIVAVTLGVGDGITWKERLLPLLVLIAIFMGGMMVPAVSLVEEQQKKTIQALAVTPVSLGEVYLAKGAMGAALSLFMGVIILALNQAFGSQPALLLPVLSLGAIMAATVGILLGTTIKDLNSLFAVMKFIGLFLYAPALVYLFPQVPGWLGMVFPTYYVIAPIIEISLKNGAWAGISLEVFILVWIILIMWGLILLKIKASGSRPVGAVCRG